MSMTLERAKTIFLRKKSGFIINSIMDTPSGYIFSAQPKNWNDGETILGGYHRIDKNTGKYSEYSAVMDPKEFKYALNHTLYTRDVSKK